MAVSNALPALYEKVIADKRRGSSGPRNALLTSNKFDVPALLWKLDIPDLERLAAALETGMRAEAAAAQDCDEAIRLFRQALDLNPYCDMAEMGCGVCLFEQGKVREAVECLERAIRINPHNKQAERNLKAINSHL